MTSSELIEAAEVAILEAWTRRAQNPPVQTGLAECAAIAALAVFEETQKPTADEREALRQGLYEKFFGVIHAEEEDEREAVMDVVFALGFRRPVQGEPTSEAVQRGTFGHAWPCPLFYVENWKRIESGHEPVRDCVNPAACSPPAVQGEPLRDTLGWNVDLQWAPQGESATDAHREIPPNPEGPASCTGCGWLSRRIGINSHAQFLAHKAALRFASAVPEEVGQ